MRTLILLVMFFSMFFSFPSFAAENFIKLETRTNITVPVFYIKQELAIATVIILPGGGGGFGKPVNGKPSSKNFLVRSHDYFAEADLNVAIMGRASDMSTLDYATRISPAHMQDIKLLVEFLKKDTGLPVWLVGTSRGTVSATAAAISFGNNRLAGIILTSSVVNPKKTGAVPSQRLEEIRVPVLVLHHEKDGCKVCAPHKVSSIIKGLKNTPIKKQIMISGGVNPTGNPCGPMHYHGFIGREKSTVDLITAWIKNPTP